MIHLAKGGTFTHASLSITPSTDNFFSYARRKIKNPFNAGLIVENIHTEVFAQYPQCHSAVYELEVSDEAYEKMNQNVKRSDLFLFIPAIIFYSKKKVSLHNPSLFSIK